MLVGTITIEVSELLSKMLKKEGIKHNVLNAKYHEQEAAIVADAGLHGAVTIATNMAGRGTDINLLLCFLNCTRKHLMFNLLTVFYTKCIENSHQSF